MEKSANQRTGADRDEAADVYVTAGKAEKGNKVLFEKKIDFYKKKDRETWEQIRKALRKEGIRHVSAGHYFGDSLAPNGIGGQLDPRNFGSAGRIDRDIYYIRIREEDADKAREAIRRHGLTAQVIDYSSENGDNEKREP